MEHISNNTGGSGIFIQIGAGAGDQDSSTNFHDGFADFIKKLPRDRIKKIILVEPNPYNIPFLKKSWEDYPEATIYQLGILPKYVKDKDITFYYHEDDGPHYQVTSVNINHIMKHYPNKDETGIKTFTAPAKHLEEFIHEITNEEIELLALDIEGIDAEVLLDLDYNNLKLKFLSFEHLHLGDHKCGVLENLKNNKFQYLGNGIDYHGYDYLYVRV